MDSFLRWAGSKRQLLKRLTALCPQKYNRYLEPFAGSACMFFHLEPKEAILGDLNSELMQMLRTVQRDVSLVLQCLRRFRRGKRAYYSLRALDPNTLSDVEAAARFIFLNHYCFNGIFRTNMEGKFNVPYAPPKNGSSINEERIMQSSQALQKAILCDGDFEATLLQARPGDFVYLDPPYAVEARRVFRQYHPRSFSIIDLKRLRTALESLDSKGVKFLITYEDSSEARTLLRPWSSSRLWTNRHIAGFSGNRRGAYELIATNKVKGKHHVN